MTVAFRFLKLSIMATDSHQHASRIRRSDRPVRIPRAAVPVAQSNVAPIAVVLNWVTAIQHQRSIDIARRSSERSKPTASVRVCPPGRSSCESTSTTSIVTRSVACAIGCSVANFPRTLTSIAWSHCATSTRYSPCARRSLSSNELPVPYYLGACSLDHA